jgi:hypothetical protein
MTRLVVVTGILPFMLLGCSSSDSTSAVHDSAGVRIIENQLPAWTEGEEWRVEPTPTLLLGVDGAGDSPVAFSNIVAAFLLDNGLIVVVDYSNPHIRFFDSSGALVKSAGRAGQGPGEFGEVRAAFRIAGDTLVISETSREMTLLSDSGAWIREFLPEEVHPAYHGMFIDGGIVAVPLRGSGDRTVAAAPMPRSRQSAVVADSMDIAIADAAGRIQHSFGKMEYYRRTPILREFFGSVRYHAARRRYYTAYGDEYAIVVYTQTGDPEMIVRREVPPKAVTLQAAEQAKEDYVAELKRGLYYRETGDLGAYPRYLATATAAPFHPQLSGLQVDSREHLWVREYRFLEDGVQRSLPQPAEGGAPQVWNVFDPDGRWLGSVEIPNRLQITEIGDNHVIGIWRDADLVESVRVYGLTRTRR